MMRARQSNRAFGLMFATLFGSLAAVGWLAFDTQPFWAAAVATGFATFALIAPETLLPLNRLWGAFARRLGQVNNYVLLGLFFYVFVLPVGLALRAFGRDPMHRKPGSKAKTYWRPVERDTTPETLRDMF